MAILNGNLHHKTTQSTLNNYLQDLLTLLAKFVQHKEDELVIKHEDGTGLSFSYIVSPKFQTNMAERLPQEVGAAGS